MRQSERHHMHAPRGRLTRILLAIMAALLVGLARPTRAQAAVTLTKDGLESADRATCVIDVDSYQDFTFEASEGSPFRLDTRDGVFKEYVGGTEHVIYGVYVDYTPQAGVTTLPGYFEITYPKGLLDADGNRHDLHVRFSNVIYKWARSPQTGPVAQQLIGDDYNVSLSYDGADEAGAGVENPDSDGPEIRQVGRPGELPEVMGLPERLVVDVLQRIRKLDRPEIVVALERPGGEPDERVLVARLVPDREPEVVVRASEGAALVGRRPVLAVVLVELRPVVLRTAHVEELHGVELDGRIVVREDEVVAGAAGDLAVGSRRDADGEPVEARVHGQREREKREEGQFLHGISGE